jgi:hypothetical protein
VASLLDQPGAASWSSPVVTARRPPLPNGAFVAISMAIIIPMSIVAGGWLGLIAVGLSLSPDVESRAARTPQPKQDQDSDRLWPASPDGVIDR